MKRTVLIGFVFTPFPFTNSKKVVYLKQQFKYTAYETNTFFSWNTSDSHFFHGILLIVLILSFMACKDDHGPIYLVSATDHQQITDDQLEISPFSKGEKFLIRGGDGNYTIKNEKKEVVDYRYDGDTLTFIPVSIGETSTLIADRSGNSYTLTIVVNNPQNNYRVESISAEVEGDNLTKGENCRRRSGSVRRTLAIHLLRRLSIIRRLENFPKLYRQLPNRTF